MSLHKILLVACVILGIALIIFPMLLTTPCDQMLELSNGSSVYMKCHWTAVVAAILGGITTLNGGVLLLKKSMPCATDYVGMLCCGLAEILVACCLIGTCKGRNMACVMGMKPAICVLSSLLIIICAFGILIALKRRVHGRRS